MDPYRRRDTLEVYDVEPRHSERPMITGYRILVLVLAITFGLSKAKLAYQGYSTALNTLDWLYGVAAFLMLYWLGIYEKYAPHMAPWFFDLDYLSYAWNVIDRTPPEFRQRQD